MNKLTSQQEKCGKKEREKKAREERSYVYPREL